MHNHEVDSQEDRIVPEDLLDLNEIIGAFGIEDWRSSDPALSTHMRGLELMVEVEGQRYMLHERAEGMVGEDLSHRYAFQHYLQQQGIPIPNLRPTLQGEPAAMIGEDYFELQQLAVGEIFTTSDTHSLDWVEAAGAMLGRIHQASSRYTGPQHRWPAEVHIGAMAQNCLNLARGKAETSEVHALASGLSTWVEQWEAVLPAAMVSIGAGGPLPELHIHGDYHAFNLRFDTRNVTAVMGLEASHWEKRIFEVAYALFYFSALTWEPGESLARPLVKRGFEPERARHFMRAYSERCPAIAAEAALLSEALMLIAPVATINGPLEDLFYAPEGIDLTLIDDIMERLSWAMSLPTWLRRAGRSLSEMWI